MTSKQPEIYSVGHADRGIMDTELFHKSAVQLMALAGKRPGPCVAPNTCGSTANARRMQRSCLEMRKS
ncbi:MAG: hypothetical protein ACYDDO_11615 [Acidiferrobacterales bacterium]